MTSSSRRRRFLTTRRYLRGCERRRESGPGGRWSTRRPAALASRDRHADSHSPPTTLEKAIMVRKRAAFLASMVAALAMMLGLTASAAQATPKHYPPPPPSLVVDRGVVKAGASVRATGREFEGRERVFITVTFRAAGSHR